MSGLTIIPPVPRQPCVGINPNGQVCGLKAWKGSRYCGRHQPIPEVAASGNARTLARAQAAADRRAAAEAPVPFANIRYCAAAKADGTPCRGSALKGEEFCRLHKHGSRGIMKIDAEIRRTQVEERTHLLKRIKLEIGKNPNRVFNVLFEGLEATLIRYDSKTGTYIDTGLPDNDMRLKCFQELADRIYGKSTNRIEHSGASGGPITIAAIVGDAEDFRAVLEAGKLAEWYEQIDDAEDAVEIIDEQDEARPLLHPAD